MPFEMTLWRVAGSKLDIIAPAHLEQEQRLEDWIAKDPSILGMDIALIGRQVQTAFGGRIDLLALDRDANCVVLELKRGRTPRDLVAQLLDYGAWVKDLGYNELDQISTRWIQKSVATIFQDTFGDAIPDTVNASHNLIVVASDLDDSSERIISYLSEEYGVSINAVFFTFFRDNSTELLGRAWLKDPVETIERSEGRKRAPWSGYWFVNVGEGEHRNWDDNRKYGYIGAGQGEKYSRPLRHLQVGDKIFAYMKGIGYVGYGEVTKEAAPIRDFVVDQFGRPLLDLPLRAVHAAENKDSAEDSEWAVGVKWLKEVPREQAKTFKGAFANQNIVCKLRDPKTLEFLRAEFGAA
jgi:Endonuclease NucS